MNATFVIRPARMAEIEAAADLLNEHSRRLHGVDDQPASELLQYWQSPDVDFENDVLLAEGSDGSLVGYADLGVHGEHVWLDVRAIEDEALPVLVEAIEKRAATKKPAANLIGYGSEPDRALRAVYEAAGYRLIRSSLRMEVGLEDELPAPEWPAGFTVRTMRQGEDERIYEGHMTSFADSWMFNREPLEIWRHWFIKDAAFDPSLWFLAEHGDDLAGIALTRAAENELGLGWVRVLGVMPGYRRRGLGQALLRHTFSEYARRGFDRVGLGVDAENPTGAVGVYERAGMHVARRNLLFEKVVRSGD
jgi:mycothiol synthase